MTDTPARTSKRPYLLRAMHDWLAANGQTPHLIVDSEYHGGEVPRAYVKDGKVVLNLSTTATQHLLLGNTTLEFDARFGGIVHHEGRLSEMKTGDAKALVATLAVYLTALVGKAVHVVTVNAYLAKCDAAWMGQVSGILGLTTGDIVPGLADRPRRARVLALAAPPGRDQDPPTPRAARGRPGPLSCPFCRPGTRPGRGWRSSSLARRRGR